MSKIFEALQVAEKETRQEPMESGPPVKTHPVTPRPVMKAPDFVNDMVTLYQSIESRLGELERKTILFMGAREGEGTSTIVREFALVASRKLRKSVFLLDAGHCNPHKRHVFFHIDPECTLQQIPQKGNLIEELQCAESMDIEMYLSPSDTNPATINFYSPRIADFWNSLKERFDLVLIDSMPLSLSPDGIEVARKVDGVVIVVEAEKTRWPVVENLKEKILQGGGNILGIVLNKRRFHIPEKIYEKL